jgi:nucleotide-binding universal stress UspA family protein
MTQAPGRQIVVGVDGSAASAAAVRWAVREARLRRASVHLVCAYNTDTRLRAPYATRAWTREDAPRAAAQASLDRAAGLVRGALPPGRLIAELVDEPPARALLERVAGAELLVLGTSRPAVPPGQPPLPIGPVARVCLRRARCPVVMVAVGDAGSDEHVRPDAGSLAVSGGRHPAPPRRVPASLG